MDPIAVYRALAESTSAALATRTLLDSKINEIRLRRWHSKAPGLAKEMLNSRAKAVECLSSPDSIVRRTALEILAIRFAATEDKAFDALLEFLAFSDTDSRVRASAVEFLSNRLIGTDDLRIGRRLAELVRDEGSPVELRWAAYRGLLDLRRLLTPRVLRETRVPFLERRFPGSYSIDWNLVDSFLVESRTSEPVSFVDTLPETQRDYLRALFASTDAHRQRDFHRAIQLLNSALNDYPDDPVLRFTRGDALMEIGDIDAAIIDFTHAIEVFPAPKAFRRRRDAYLKKGENELAQRDLEAAIETESRMSGERKEDTTDS